MSAHSVAEAQDRLPELIDRALKGEDVVITREGEPVVELKAVPKPKESKRVTKEALEWLDAHRIKVTNPKMNAAELVRAMRDEDDP